jgi:L-ascorbate metabolism protein UlaG (beta-lactamase superfamily)
MLGAVRITILGHASVLIEAGPERILVDPLFADDFASGSIGFAPSRRIDLAAMPPPTTIVITHHHLDHWHAPSVERFDRSTPIVTPTDEWLGTRLDQLGFRSVRATRPWDELAVGDVELLITPSASEIDELGFVASHAGSSYWHMSDALVDRSMGRRIRELVGPVTVVATRYLGIESLIAYQRGLGTGHDERDLVVELLEAACAADPALVFPYFAAIAFLGEHAWANRWAKPFAPSDVAALLRRRRPESQVEEVLPGDRIDVDGRAATVVPQASPFVAVADPEVPRWEPVDVSTLTGIAGAAEEAELRTRLEAAFRDGFLPWLQGELLEPASPFQLLGAWGIQWECVIHLGGGRRLSYRADFSVDPARFVSGDDPSATYSVHLGGGSLLQVLRGDAGAELFWAAGDARMYERVIGADPDGVWAPPVRGWSLFEALPEPLTYWLRHQRIVPGAEMSPSEV